MKILGINVSHNPSISLVENDKVLSFYDETRFRKNKTYEPLNILRYNLDPKEIYFQSIEKKINVDIDKIIVASPIAKGAMVVKNYDETKLQCVDQVIEGYTHIDRDMLKHLCDNQLVQKFSSLKEIMFFNEHHIYHALCGFYFSSFDEAICIVMDGSGAQPLRDYPGFQETDSVYYIDKSKITALYKKLSCYTFRLWAHLYPGFSNKKTLEFEKDNCRYHLSSEPSKGILFSQLTRHLGLNPSDNEDEDGFNSGKTMGLAAYGNTKGFRKEDLAKKLQVKTEKDTIELIEYAASLYKCKNIILSGGYALNCLNNYKYVKKFPKLNFFVDPCAHDGGTAIGAALYANRWFNGNIR